MSPPTANGSFPLFLGFGLSLLQAGREVRQQSLEFGNGHPSQSLH
jgi:hypothetical protein